MFVYTANRIACGWVRDRLVIIEKPPQSTLKGTIVSLVTDDGMEMCKPRSDEKKFCGFVLLIMMMMIVVEGR